MTETNQVAAVEELLETLGGIPPVPEVARQVLRLSGAEDARLPDITRLIATDQGLATQVLSACHSASYGIPRRIDSLSRAAALLGFKAVRNLVVLHSIPRRRSGTATYAEAAIWTHAAAGAVVARLLASEKRICDPEEAMLGGLVHDAGRLVLNLLMPERYEPVMRSIYNRDGDSIAIERRALGCDHTLVGRLVLRAWDFPEQLIEAVATHHDDPAALEGLPLLVRAADEQLWRMGFGVREAPVPDGGVPPALAKLGYAWEDLPAQEERVRAAVAAGTEFFGA